MSTYKSLINQLASLSDHHNEALIMDSIKDLIQIGQLSDSNSDLKLVNASIKELLKSFEVFHSHKEKPKLCIFGSARTRPDHPNYKMAVDITKKMTHLGYDIITGAGPGIMEAGNKGAENDCDFGLNILLPFEQTANDYIRNSERLINFKYFFTRKLIFIKESQASIIFPGGFGTHDELFEVLTLIQTGRCAPRPIILIANPESNYWNRWHKYVKEQLCDREYISEDNLSLYKIVSDVNIAIEWIQHYYSVYHSIRYTKEFAMMRINKRVKQTTLDELSEQFYDIITSGKIEQYALSELQDDYDVYPEKPRLVFKFDQENYGKINEMIITLNQLES